MASRFKFIDVYQKANKENLKREMKKTLIDIAENYLIETDT